MVHWEIIWCWVLVCTLPPKLHKFGSVFCILFAPFVFSQEPGWLMSDDHADTQEAVVGYFSQADKWESHAEPQQTTAAGNVGDPAHLLRLPEPLGVRLLDEYVDNGQVLTCIVVNLELDLPGQGLVAQRLGAPSVISIAVGCNVRCAFQCLAQIGVVGS